MSTEDIDHALTWFRFALEDLAAARTGSDGRTLPRIVAFHARGAAEKALKAALVLSAADPPRTDDLEQLRRALPVDSRARRKPPDLTRLSGYGFQAQYPSAGLPVLAIDSATAVRQATIVVRLVREAYRAME